MSPYEKLEALVASICAEFPLFTTTMRSLRSTRDMGDALIIERSVIGGVRVVRIPASAAAACSPYWGELPSAGKRHLQAYGEEHRCGDVASVVGFFCALLFELRDWRNLDMASAP